MGTSAVGSVEAVADDGHTTGSDPVVGGIDLGNGEVAERVRRSLARIERLMVEELSDGAEFLQDIALHLAKAGGKRFRPMFTVLAGGLGPRPEDPRLITAGAALEMVHLATLYHDDVMDEAAIRRGSPSVNARWGNSVAILSGDYVFAHASRLVSTLGAEAVRDISETFADLVTGQLRETLAAPEATDEIDNYLRVVWEKTGSLIAAAGRFGGQFSGATPEQVQRLARLGDAVGTAFQICDDLIDISSESGQSGKTPGTDLREGVHTLPVLYALREPGADGDRLRSLLATPPQTDADVAEALKLLAHSTGMIRAKAKLHEYTELAYAELAALPQGPANAALVRLVDSTLERIG